MTGAATASGVIASVIALVDWVAVQRRWRVVEWVCKPAVMVALIAMALSLHPLAHEARAWFVAALVLSLAGDVFLMLPPDGRFVEGLASFLMGHLAYIGGFVTLGVDRRGAALAAVIVVVAAGATVGRRILVALSGSALRPPVAAYMGVISVMVICAAGTGLRLAIVGAALFYVSDALIAWNRFVTPVRGGKVAIIVTYHLAQLALVASLAR